METVWGSLSRKKSGGNGQLLDASNIMELVENQQVFTTLVDHKFHRQRCQTLCQTPPTCCSHSTNPHSHHIYFEVLSNIVEPALLSQDGSDLDKPVSQETFLEEFKIVAMSVANHLKEQPVIVAHSENTFDGSGVKRLLSNKFELDKTLSSAIETLPKDRNGKLSKEYLRVTLDTVAPSAGLPPVGAIEEMDKVIGEVFKMVNADDAKVVKEDEFKKLLTEILGSIMLQLEGNPISVSSNSVVHEPLDSSSTLLQPSPSETAA
ncbi:hypothetical protein AAZX31_12G022600 [Glycine max]|uniref:EF-hand domain-containing protein n=1 Tax=Glycine max TaxID=3847 RepID=I1LPF8_SOYBN|nr:hypothetical protein GmHk_12G033716 [Glycine max]KRH24131.1 hypothetical protein GLYMA_12G023500v4 [Glycine max]